MLSKTVVHEESTGSTINVGPRILDFACCGKEIRDSLIVCAYKIDKIIVLNMLGSELKFEDKARISFS